MFDTFFHHSKLCRPMIMCEKILCREVQGYGDISQGFLSRYINVKNDTVPYKEKPYAGIWEFKFE